MTAARPVVDVAQNGEPCVDGERREDVRVEGRVWGRGLERGGGGRPPRRRQCGGRCVLNQRPVDPELPVEFGREGGVLGLQPLDHLRDGERLVVQDLDQSLWQSIRSRWFGGGGRRGATLGRSLPLPLPLPLLGSARPACHRGCSGEPRGGCFLTLQLLSQSFHHPCPFLGREHAMRGGGGGGGGGRRRCRGREFGIDVKLGRLLQLGPKRLWGWRGGGRSLVVGGSGVIVGRVLFGGGGRTRRRV